MVLALPNLLLLAALIVAFGLITMGRAFVDVIFWMIRKVVDINPLLSWLLGKGIDAAHQYLTNKLGAAADSVAGAMAASWHFLAEVVSKTGWAVWHVALAVDRVAMRITDPIWLGKMVMRAGSVPLALWELRRQLRDLQRPVTIINKVITNPVRSVVAPAVKVVTAPVRVASARFEAWTRSKIRALEASVAHAGAAALPLPGTAVADLRDALNRLRRRVARIDTRGLAYIGSAVFVATLSRFGLNWLRCQNVKRAGRGVCRMDNAVLDELLTSSLLVLAPLSIATLADELGSVMDDMNDAVVWFAASVDG